MKQCPNCGSHHVTSVYQKSDVVTFQNVPLDSHDKARNVPKGSMNLCFCESCTLLYNHDFDENLVGYGDDYDNNQSHSLIFEEHVNRMSQKIVKDNGFNHHKICEIGCGVDGYFLKKLIKNTSNICFGYDSSLKQNIEETHLKLYKKYYSKDEEQDFDVVLSRHVIEHIIDNKNILKLLKQQNPNAVFFTETPSLEWIVENNTFFDIFYEHCSYFSAYALSTLFSSAGLYVKKIDRVLNDQYQWLETSTKKADLQKIEKILTLEKVKTFFQKIDQMINEYQILLSEAKTKGKIAVWGAGAKGVTFTNLIDPDQKLIDYVIDISPQKQGKFVPGGGHAIVSPDALNDDFSMVVIMNGNYEHEIKTMFKDTKIQFKVL